MSRTGKIKLNPQINLPFHFLIQKYFFHDNPTWNINYPRMYSKQVLGVPTHGKKKLGEKESEKSGIGIEHFGIGIELELINLRWNWN